MPNILKKNEVVHCSFSLKLDAFDSTQMKRSVYSASLIYDIECDFNITRGTLLMDIKHTLYEAIMTSVYVTGECVWFSLFFIFPNAFNIIYLHNKI